MAIGKADIGMAIVAQRIIRRKGSESATPIGKVHTFNALAELREHTLTSRHVYTFLADNGEGTMRSGRKMRPVDLHVRNTLTPKKRVF